MKQWKKIPGYSSYEVSTDGEIKTYNWKNTGQERIMKPALDGSGYLRTMLKNDQGKIETVKVHRIVAKTFLPNPENKPQVNHINHIRTDNRLINLEWCTASENQKWSFTCKRRNITGERNPHTNLKDEDVIEMRKLWKHGRKNKYDENGQLCMTRKELADKFGTTVDVVKNIIQKRTWKHLL
jgi:hypothetical protein